jgi:hypothetical protein
MYWVITNEFILNQMTVVYVTIPLCLFLSALTPFIRLINSTFSLLAVAVAVEPRINPNALLPPHGGIKNHF